MNEVVVLVPTLNRPLKIAPLIDSFRRSNTPGRLLFVVDGLDLRLANLLKLLNAESLACPDLSWPKRINYGYRHTTEPWILCAADDIHFHPGWFQATEKLRYEGYCVIGTNDLGNPRVMRGEHATHPLVRREYVDEEGTLDGPGAILCEGYRHNFSDDEVVATAKARGVWAHCADSIVEHLHPYWNKGAVDDTYLRNESSMLMDRALWLQRSQRVQGERIHPR